MTTFESGVPFTVFNGLDSDGIGGSTGDRPNFNPLGQPGVRARPVVDAQGFITGYVNPDANNAPIDPTTARYIGLPAYVAGPPAASRARATSVATPSARPGSTTGT